MGYSIGSILLAFYAFSAVFLLASSEDLSGVSKLETFYYDKCLKVSGSSGAFDKLRTDVYEMYKYLQYAIEFLPAQKTQFCNEQRKNLLYRANEIKGDLKACLPKEEKFLADFLKESFEEFLHFLCHKNAVYSVQFFDKESQQCREVIEKSNTNDLEYCLNRIFSPTRNYITKSDICDDLTVARKCFTQLVEQYCPRSYDTKNLNTKFFDYLSKPCSACSNSFSLVMGLALVVFNYIFR